MSGLTYFYDPGHGYLRVPLSEVEKLNISDKVSGFSFKDEEFAYLECHEDIRVYLDAIGAKSIDDLKPTTQYVDEFPHIPVESFNPLDPWLQVNPSNTRTLGASLLRAEMSGMTVSPLGFIISN